MRLRNSASLIAGLCALAIAIPAPSADPPAGAQGPSTLDLGDYAAMRALLVARIGANARLSEPETGILTFDPRVMDAIGRVPRHEFVPPALRPLAYLDIPLPLGPLPQGQEQNLSQPFLVALMTHLARIGPDDVVFETGTDVGYHAAVLSLLAARVYSMEVVAPLVDVATALLARLGYANVEVRRGDGYYGWTEHGPYDAIIVKEAVHHVPPPLINQLKVGGRIVAPVGPLDGAQTLTLIEKRADGTLATHRILPVRFAPLQGGERI